ncbi:mucin-binding protein [uncultured Lacticaseibacillus sp.]|uniref:mucin-binding protein n=1 Tax=uncultured Lacticaseibacillus sp. TaxID=2775882 RepID=UPI0025951C64|nr:LPXTG cell wall anchor domain-containing protein [uncultured Lacticaseibacillus sp.]
MTKNNAPRYTAEQTEHYKMYKQGKIWAFALISTLAIGAGTLALGHDTVSADTSSTPVTATTNARTATSGNTAQLSAASTSSATSESSSVAPSSASSDATSTSSNTAASSSATSTSSTPVSAASTTSSAASSNAVSATPTSVTSSVASSATTSAATSGVATQTLVEPTSAALSGAKSHAAAQYSTTGQPQQVNAVAAAPADTSNAVLKTSTATVGYGSNQKELSLTLVITNPQAGDVYTVTIPADTYILQFDSVGGLTADQGTTTTSNNADGTKTITDTFTTSQSGVVTQIIKYILKTNYSAQDKPMTTIGSVTKTVTYTVNGVAQTPVTFTQTIQPYASMTGMSLTYPTGSATTALQSGTEYVFSYNVGEANGILDNDYQSARVNSAVNYGTTLTIAVPAGFALNAGDTAKLNAFTDATTITQPGGAGTDIIITVPKGSGSQGWEVAAAYRLAGSFTQAATDKDTTYTATNAGAMSQKVDDAGTVYTATSPTPWSVVIAGSDSAVKTAGVVTATGNSSTTQDKLVLDNDTTNDPSYLAQFTFANNTVADQKNVQFDLDIPDGVVATGIVVPKGEVSDKNYLPGDLTFTYTLTLADGTTETGTAAGGDTITSTNGAAIRHAALVVNELAAGAALNLTGALTTKVGNVITTNNTFSVLGTLNATLDDGTAVKNGDVLIFGISMTFDGQSAPSATAKMTETVTEPYAAVYGYVLQNNQAPGATNAGTMAIMTTGNFAHTTDSIYEPIFYYVIPAATTFVSATNVDPSATVSEFTADDGRTVVKIDYTGTGLSVKTTTGQVQLNLANKADALPGTYSFAMYIYSPTTALDNATKVTDTSYTEGNADAVSFYHGQGISAWTINTAGIFTDFTFAKGTQDTDAVTTGNSNAYATTDSHFYVSLVNTANDGQDHDGTVIVNLPAEGDSEGSGFTFALSGPVTVPANYTIADGTGAVLNATVLYSTSRANVVNNQAKVDTSSYMTADQLATAGIAWSDVRSVLISIANIASVTSTGRIDLTGMPVDGADHTDTTGYLQTALSIDGGAYSVTGKAQGSSNLTLRGYSTVSARYHYVDVNGNDQYIDIPDLTQTLENGVDQLATLPTSYDELSTVDQNLIPEGYELSGTYKVFAADGKTAGKAASGVVASRDFDGDIIQYELQGKYVVTFNVVNDTTGETTVAKTVRGASGQQATFNVDVPNGYMLSPNQEAGVTVTKGAVNYTLTAVDQQVVNVHIVKVNNLTDDLQYGLSEVTDTGTVLNSSTGTATARVTYVLLGKDDNDTATTIAANIGAMGALAQLVTDGYTLVGIKATINGQTVTADVGTDTYNNLVQRLNLNAMAAGAFFDAPTYYNRYFDTTFSLSADPNVQIQLVVSADPQTVNVIYKDADNNNQQVGATVPVTGTTGATYNWTASVPTGYKLATGQAATGSYAYTTAADQQIVIYLAHEHAQTTETRAYTVTYTGAPKDKLPATSTQSVTWNEDIDAVTGAKNWTPQSTPAVVAVTPIAGYTASDTAVAFVVTALNNEDPVDESKVVTYTPNAQTTNIQYVDDDNNGAQVGALLPINGTTDSSFTWTTDVPAGYQLATGQVDGGRYTFAAADNAPIVVHLTHAHTTATSAVDYTAHYQGVANGGTPADKAKQITWTADTDNVTHVTTWTSGQQSITVDSPAVAGYTADRTAVTFTVPATTTTAPTAQTQTVTYTADKQTTILKYVDDDNGGAQVDASVPFTGTTGSSFRWSTDLPQHYQLATGQADSGTYTFAATENAPIVVHLTHTHMVTTKDVDYTVHYQGVTDGANPTDGQQQITWTGDTDDVTGKTTWTSGQQSVAVASPTVAGYTPDQASVTFTVPATSVTAPTAKTATVTYTANGQSTTLSYVDDITGATVGMPTTLTGATNSTTGWTAVVPTGYVLADGQAAVGSYTFAATGNTPIVVHLTHGESHGTATTSRTITYVVAGNATQAPAAVTQTVQWRTTTDLVTGATVATPQGNFAGVTTPYLPATTRDGAQTSWQPDVANVAGMQLTAQTGMPTNPADVTVTYRPYAQVDTNDPHVWTKHQVGPAVYAEQYVVNFVTTTGKVVGTTQLVGNAGNQFGVTAPTGYHFVDKAAGTVTLPASNTAAINILVAADSVDNDGTKTPGGDDDNTTHHLPSTGDNTTTTGAGTQGKGTATDATRTVPTAAWTLPTTGSTNHSLPATGGRSLPQTGDQQNAWAILGVGLLTATLGLFGIKRRRDTER